MSVVGRGMARGAGRGILRGYGREGGVWGWRVEG